MNKDNTVKCAGGFIIQLMPFAEDAAIDKLEENSEECNICYSSCWIMDVHRKDCWKHFLGNLGIEVLDTLPTQFHCNCSKERVEKAVASVGREDLQAMIDDGEDIEVKCDFCNSTYKYTVDELKEILKESNEEE